MKYWVKTIRYSNREYRNPIVVIGFPGIGLVGLQAIRYMAEKLNAEKVAEIYSEYLYLQSASTGIMVGPDGTFTLPKYTIYGYSGTPSMLLVESDTQPVVWAVYKSLDTVFSFLRQFRPKGVIVLTGYSSRGEREVFYVASSNWMLDKLKKLGISSRAKVGSVIMAAGASIVLSKLYGWPCISLTASVKSAVDIEGTRILIETLSKLLGFSIELSDLDEMAKEAERAEMVIKLIAPTTPREGRVDYIL
ncbi:MAG: hypothetical protein DRN96_01105 [Thermoproteota archaeon]|nr:MAG: hypothetical protein DRN96_01105 [Candidatus Korarchaeota archaeon]RLG55215.1 MAG: hypothetical protein DRN99_03290 [Candidatus Korarchaeota archaeon]